MTASTDNTTLVSSNWSNWFRDCAARSQSKIRIVSPFIKLNALKLLLKKPNIHSQIITRFNLADCASLVNDLEAVRFALKRGGIARGIKGLHTKLYIFDEREVLITSANLTLQGQRKNHELGVHSVDSELVPECVNYSITYGRALNHAKQRKKKSQIGKGKSKMPGMRGLGLNMAFS